MLHGTNNKFGWSEELLEYGSSDGNMSSGGEDNESCSNATEGSSPSSATSSSSSSGGGAKSWAGRKPWNTSPKRTFVRNFP